MKKFGFTLSELLIAIGIIGVLAAITAPLITGIMPDKGKVMVLKNYKIIQDIVQDILNDPSLYLNNGTCEGFECVELPLNPDYQDSLYQGNSKFGAIFASKLNGKIDYAEPGDSATHFSTADQAIWGVYFGADEIDIHVDINGDEKPNCYYWLDKDKCKNPDMFSFEIDPETGIVRGDEPLTAAFINNPNKLNDKKNDLKTAQKDTKTYQTREDLIRQQ